MNLQLRPIRYRDAAAFVNAHHRHHPAPPGAKFTIGLDRDGELVGVIMCGRPVARHYDDGETLEVNRSCVIDGVANGNSMLYGDAWRAAKALGYRRLITYTRGDESGVSLRAAGWRVVAERKARSGWDTPSRPRANTTQHGLRRVLWEAAK